MFLKVCGAPWLSVTEGTMKVSKCFNAAKYTFITHMNVYLQSNKCEKWWSVRSLWHSSLLVFWGKSILLKIWQVAHPFLLFKDIVPTVQKCCNLQHNAQQFPTCEQFVVTKLCFSIPLKVSCYNLPPYQAHTLLSSLLNLGRIYFQRCDVNILTNNIHLLNT